MKQKGWLEWALIVIGIIIYYYLIFMADLSPYIIAIITVVGALAGSIWWVLKDREKHVNVYADKHIILVQQAIDTATLTKQSLKEINDHKEIVEIENKIRIANKYVDDLAHEKDYIFHPAIFNLITAILITILAIAFIIGIGDAEPFAYQSLIVISVGVVCVVIAFITGQKSEINFTKIKQMINIINEIRKGRTDILDIIYERFT